MAENYYESEVDTRITRTRLALASLAGLGLWVLIVKAARAFFAERQEL